MCSSYKQQLVIHSYVDFGFKLYTKPYYQFYTESPHPAQEILKWNPKLARTNKYRSQQSYNHMLYNIASHKGITPLTKLTPTTKIARTQTVLSNSLISKARNLSRHDYYTPFPPFICPLLRSYKEDVPGNGKTTTSTRQTTHHMNTMTYVTEWTGHDIQITLQMNLIIYFYLTTYISYPLVVHTT